MNMFDEVKEKVLLSNYVRGNKKISTKRIRLDKCPFCGHGGCFDILPSSAKNKFESFDCRSCGKQGSIIDYYCLENNLDANNKSDLSKALNELCKIGGIENKYSKTTVATTTSSSEVISPKSEVTKPYENKFEDKRTVYDFTDIAEKLHQQLLQDQQGMNYFIERGFTEETIKKFKLGYNPLGFNDAFKDISDLHLMGGLAECYTYFIPTFDDKGKCTYILPRLNQNILNQKLQSKELYETDEKGNKRKYPKTMNLRNVPTTLFNFDEAMKDNVIFITEGWGDALSLQELGSSSLAINSVSNVNKFIKDIQKIKDYQGKYYVIALDNDTAGVDARNKLEEELKKLKCKVKHLYPKGEGIKDINDMLVNNTIGLIESIGTVTADIQQEKEEILKKDSCYFHLDSTINKFIMNKNRVIPSTGYKCLDDALGGGLYNSLYVVGGITGLGKTSIVLNIIENLAKQNIDVLFISLEMSREELIAKSIARNVREVTDIRYKKARYLTQKDIERGNFDTSDSNFQKALLNYKEASKHIFIKEANYNYNTEKIREDIINHKMLKEKPPILVLDYLQVLPCLKDYSDDKKNIDFNITELKRISREFDIPVLVVSSINREFYKKQIDFNAFKSSGNIEFTADVVVGLQYSFMENIGNMKDNEIIDLYKEEKIKNPRSVQTVILKNRNGSIGKSTNFLYEPQYNYFKEV